MTDLIKVRIVSSYSFITFMDLIYTVPTLLKSKGRKKGDKREYKKDQDWKREKGRLIAKQFK